MSLSKWKTICNKTTGWLKQAGRRRPHRLSSGSSQAGIYHDRPDPRNICTESGLLFSLRGERKDGVSQPPWGKFIKVLKDSEKQSTKHKKKNSHFPSVGFAKHFPFSFSSSSNICICGAVFRHVSDSTWVLDEAVKQAFRRYPAENNFG